jgi:hypothetical protein
MSKTRRARDLKRGDQVLRNNGTTRTVARIKTTRRAGQVTTEVVFTSGPNAGITAGASCDDTVTVAD